MISARENDLGAEGASEAVANDDAGWARRGERPLPEHGHDRAINVSDGGPPRRQQRHEHHREAAHAHLPPMKPLTESTKRPTPRKVRLAAKCGVMSFSWKA